jgi:hypothetical protein
MPERAARPRSGVERHSRHFRPLRPGHPIRWGSAYNASVKPCPHCGEQLGDEAISCRYCDEFIPPAEPTNFDVVLVYPGCRWFDAISVVSSLTGQKASVSRGVVLACRDAPQRVLAGSSLDDAHEAWTRLKRIGATTEIVKAS